MRQNKHVNTITIAAVLALMATGCAHVKRAERQDPANLWNQAIAFKTDDRPFSAQGKITYDSPKLTQTVNFIWRQEGSRHIRIDVFGFLGIGLASACISDDQAWLNVPLKSLYISGTISGIDSMAKEAAGLDLMRLLRTLQGEPPIETGQYSVAQDADQSYLFVFARKDTSVTYRLDPQNARITGYRLEVGGSPEFSISYDDWKLFNNNFRPHAVELFSYRDQADLKVKYSSMATEQAFTKDVWEQPMPGRGAGHE